MRTTQEESTGTPADHHHPSIPLFEAASVGRTKLRAEKASVVVVAASVVVVAFRRSTLVVR